MESLKSACIGLYRRKTRNIITIIGIAVGIMSVIIITSIGDLGKQIISSELENMGLGGIAIGVDTTVTSAGLSDKELSIIEDDSAVDVCMPLMVNYTNASAHDTETKCVTLGVDENAVEIASLELLYGRTISSRDVEQKNMVCVVDESFAQMMYHRSNIVGKTIQIQMGKSFFDFTVVGVVASGGSMMQGMMGEYVPTFLYLPSSTMQDLLNSTSYDQILLELSEDADSQVVTTRLTSELNDSLGVENAASAQDFVSQQATLDRIFNLVTLILTIIAGISLLVAGLSIMTVMITSVQERKREIGIKKAIGAADSRIMIEFLIESIILCLIGSALGIIIGVLISAIAYFALSIPYIPNIKAIIFCVGFSAISGALFGVYPAKKAARMRPVEALSADR